MSELESRLRQHFANQGPSQEFDASVLRRIAAQAQIRGSQTERAAAAAQRYARERSELLSERRETLWWLCGTAVLAAVIAVLLAPVTGAALPRVAALLGRELTTGISFGVLLTALPLAVWLSIRQPRMDSRW